MPEETPEKEIPKEGAPEQPENGGAGAPGEGASPEPAGVGQVPGDDVPDGKADVVNRAIAKFIDVLIALLLARLPDYIGFMAGLGYLAAADGWLDGASVGKRLVGLRAVVLPDGAPAGYRESILRNSTVCVLYALMWVPLVGWLLSVAGAGFELLLMIGSPAGKRLGDEIASTVVVDAQKKEAAGFDTGAHTGL